MNYEGDPGKYDSVSPWAQGLLFLNGVRVNQISSKVVSGNLPHMPGWQVDLSPVGHKLFFAFKGTFIPVSPGSIKARLEMASLRRSYGDKLRVFLVPDPDNQEQWITVPIREDLLQKEPQELKVDFDNLSDQEEQTTNWAEAYNWAYFLLTGKYLQ